MRTFARRVSRGFLAFMGSVALALAATHAAATPTLTAYWGPNVITAGGNTTLQLTLSDDAGGAIPDGTLSFFYPSGLTNTGSIVYNSCGGNINVPNGSQGVAGTNIAIASGNACYLYVQVTSATPTTYFLSIPAGAFTGATGSSAAVPTATLVVLTPIVVTTTADSGTGSLRDAIDSANASCTPGLEIQFNIAGPGPHTITPTSALPTVSCSGLTINGYSQPGSSPTSQSPPGNNANLQVILNGSACSGCDGLTTTGSGVVVRGLSIHSFGGAGILVSGNYAYVQGNYLGTDPGGMTALGNGAGVRITAGYAYIGGSVGDGNLITANGTGIWSQSGAIVSYNQVGGRRDGSAGIGNTGRGIFYNASNYTSGSVNYNAIFSNGAQGVSVDGGTTARVLIIQNVIYGNGGVAFDLNDDGPTVNDETGPPYDQDGGPNGLVNYPVITSVTQAGGATTISGYVKSVPFADTHIEFFANSSLPPWGEGQTFIGALSPSLQLDSTGYGTFSTTFGGAWDNVSAQMMEDTCGDGCNYSSEYSPPVAAVASFSCSIYVSQASIGDSGSYGPTVIVKPGDPVFLNSCVADTYLWNTGDTSYFLNVTAPAAGVSVTYTLTATKAGATSTVSVTLVGANAGAPICTIAPSVPLPVDPVNPTTFQMNASCSPGATGFAWDTTNPSLVLDSGQGTATATYHTVPSGYAGYGLTATMTPTNAAGQGPTANRIIWFNPLTVAETSFTFPTTAAGTTSAPQTIHVQNYSDYYEPNLNVVTTGPYMVTNNCPAPVTKLSSCTIDVRFAPVVAGAAQTGSVTISFSFPGNPSWTLSLTGDATGAPGVGLTPSSLTFQPRTVNTTSGAQTVTLVNTGTNTLSIGSMGITGDFAFASACPATLAPGASCTIDVTFTPLVVGTRTGTLTITDNASGSPHTIALTGTGLSTAAAVLEVSPGAMDFPAQQVGTTSAPQAFIVSNSGNAPLTFDAAISISGEFSIVAPPPSATPPACPITLLPGESCRIDITFHPNGFNLREGGLTLATNGGDVTLALMGTGLVPEPAQLVVPSSISFDPQRVGVESTGRAVPLQNTSPYPATITELTATGDFSVSDTCTIIPVGATCSPLVTFLPTAVGPRAGTLTVRTLRDADPYTIALNGVGEENRVAIAEVTPRQVGFGNTFLSMAVVREVNIRNTGLAPLVISAIEVSGDFFADNACIGTIAPGGACQAHVTFMPTVVGGRGGGFQVISNAANGPVGVSLSGTGCFVPTPARLRAGVLLCGS